MPTQAVEVRGTEKKITGKNIKELSTKLQLAAEDGLAYKMSDESDVSKTLDRIMTRTRTKAVKKSDGDVEKTQKPATRKTKTTTAKATKVKADSTKSTKAKVATVNEEENPEEKITVRASSTRSRAKKLEEKPKTVEKEIKEVKEKKTRTKATSRIGKNVKEIVESIEDDDIDDFSAIEDAIDKDSTQTIAEVIEEETRRSEAKKTKDMTMQELLEQMEKDDEPKLEIKAGKRKLKNISEAIMQDSTKRKNGQNSAALVMATITGNQELEEINDDILLDDSIKTGFPMDVSMIDFEKERYEAEEKCIEDFKKVVVKLEEIDNSKKDELASTKDILINELADTDKNIEQQMKDLKIRQNDIVNQIAQIQEVIAGKQAELNAAGMFQFSRKSRLKQIIAESEAEIGSLEMEALAFNNKVTSLMEEATHRRINLFSSVDNVKEQSEYTTGKLQEARKLLSKMEKREYIDEAAVQRQLILNALRLYTKPMTIGQLLFYPGLSGYSVQNMSAAMNHLVTVDKSVIKVALEDNVYYLISKSAM